MKYVAVTDPALCARPLAEQVRRVLELPPAEASGPGKLPRPDMVILRAKELSDPEYERLAAEVIPLCRAAGVLCVLHSHAETARRMEYPYFHCPLPMWTGLCGGPWRPKLLGISVHSREEALLAADLGAGYVTAGHVFATDCKKGLPPRGLSFLKEVADAVQIPVYAIGGMNPSRAKAAREAGAAGICVMSGYMRL